MGPPGPQRVGLKGWLLLAGFEAEGVVVIASRPGVKPPARKFPTFFCFEKTRILVDFGVEKKVRILTIPLCWGPPEALPRHFLKIRYF